MSLPNASHYLTCTAAELDFERRMPEVYRACQDRRANGALWDDTYPLKLLELDHILKIHKPKSIVEIGSGATSLVLQANCDSVVSIEDQDWGGTATRVVEGNRVWFSETVDLVCEPPDLLYVDGPNSKSGDPDKPLLSMDAANLIAAGVCPKHILFDMRHASVVETMRQAGGRYGIFASPAVAHMLGMPWYLAPLKIHSLLSRRGS